MAITLIKSGIYCKVQQDVDEPMEKLVERAWFITSTKPKTQQEYESAVQLSRVWANNKYFGCQYNSTLMNKVKKVSENLFIEDD